MNATTTIYKKMTNYGIKNFSALRQPQLEQYLHRINLAPATILGRKPALDTINMITRNHMKSIPFENLALLCQGTPGPLATDSVFEQLVTKRRGGYCYQNTILLVGALQSLGFRASTGLARMIKWNETQKEYLVGPLIHMVGFIEAPNPETGNPTTYLLDAGRHRFQQVLEIKDGATFVNFAGETYQIRKEEGEPHHSPCENYSIYQKRAPWAELAEGVDPEGDGFQIQFSFSMERYRPADYEVFNHFATTGKKHVLQDMLFVNIASKTGGQSSFLGNAFRRREDVQYQSLDKKVDVTSLEQFEEILNSEFGLKMSEEERVGAAKSMKF
ncbi:UNVERIFIED_CONTAM: hypothetical protein HDU68_000233 [Siphonaria sp. JEL0065]|nr:hypothetical protein HDU68_000233 [Siphonaria sp. JEL0065]